MPRSTRTPLRNRRGSCPRTLDWPSCRSTTGKTNPDVKVISHLMRNKRDFTEPFQVHQRAFIPSGVLKYRLIQYKCLDDRQTHPLKKLNRLVFIVWVFGFQMSLEFLWLHALGSQSFTTQKHIAVATHNARRNWTLTSCRLDHIFRACVVF